MKIFRKAYILNSQQILFYLILIIGLISINCKEEVEVKLRIDGVNEYSINLQNLEGRNNSKIRILQPPQSWDKMYTSIYSTRTNFIFDNIQLIYDSVTKRIFTVVPDNMEKGKMNLVSYEANGINNNSEVKIFVGLHACGIKSGGQPVNSIPYNLMYIDASGLNGDRTFVIFHYNNSVNSPLPKMDCGIEGNKMSMYNYNTGQPGQLGSFNLVKTWVNIFGVTQNPATLNSKLDLLQKLICDNTCTFFQPRSSVFLSKSKKIVGLFLFMNPTDDLTSPAKKGFVISSFNLDSNNAALVFHKLLGYEYQFSPGLINVRKIYNFPNSDIIYFLLQENRNIYLFVINDISTVADLGKNVGNKILLVNDALAQDLQEGLDYDSTTKQFILFYVKEIDPNNNNHKVSALLFSLNPNFDNFGGPANRINDAFVYTNSPTNSNSIRYVKLISNFIFLCDVYQCFSAKLNLGSPQMFIGWSNIKTNSPPINNLRLGNVVMNNDTSDLLIWYSGYIKDQANIDIVIGNSTPTSSKCFFYQNVSQTKCQTKCDTGYLEFDSVKRCIEYPCPSNKPFYLNYKCSSHCSDYNSVEVINSKNYCRNIPCPFGKIYRDVSVSFNKLYHECDSACPDPLFYEPPIQNCGTYCLSNLYIKLSQGEIANQCTRFCNSGFANNTTGTKGPPYQCLEKSTCADGTFIVKRFEINRTDAFLCVSKCPTGFYIDSAGKFCLVCRLDEGFLWQNVCVNKCPTYTIVSTDGNICLNCKDSDTKWYKGECLSEIPTTTELVDEFFNVYKDCQAIDKMTYRGKCVVSCPEYSYPYDKVSYQCLEPVADLKYLHENKTLDKCPEMFGPDLARRCVKCYNVGYGKFELNRNCVDACPDKYYWSEFKSCIPCTTIGTLDNPLYVSNCVVPNCPSYATTDIPNRKCIYCRDTNQYMLNGVCVNSCPLNSEINFDTFECIYCRQNGDNYYFKNKCYFVCPEGTLPNDHFTCIENIKTCEPNPCLNGGECNIINDEVKCECLKNSTYVGQYCQVTMKYVDNFYSGHLDFINELNNNYSLYSNINKDIIDFDSEQINEIISNLEFFENNQKDFDNQFKILADNLLSMTWRYLNILNKESFIPTEDFYKIYSYLLKTSDKVIKHKQNQTIINNSIINNSTNTTNTTNTNSSNLRNLQDDTVNSIKNIIIIIKSQIIALTNSLSYLNMKNQKWSEHSINFTEFKMNFYNSSEFSFNKMTSYLIATNQSYIDFPDCESNLRSVKSVEYFVLNSISWNNTLVENMLIESNGKVDSTLPVNLQNVISFNIYNPNNYKNIAISKECGIYIGNKPFFIRFKLDFKDSLNKTLNDYYYQKDINIYDQNSKFFNDRCFIFSSDDEYDITLNYRKTYLSPNKTIECGDGCSYVAIDSYGYIVCECFSHADTSAFSVRVIESTLFDQVTGNNLQLIRCAPHVFNNNYSVKNIHSVLLGNVGFWSGFALMLLTLISINFMYYINLIGLNCNNSKTNSYLDKFVYYDAHFYSIKNSPFKNMSENIKDYENNNKYINIPKGNLFFLNFRFCERIYSK